MTHFSWCDMNSVSHSINIKFMSKNVAYLFKIMTICDKYFDEFAEGQNIQKI